MVVSGRHAFLYVSSLVHRLDRAVIEKELYGPVNLLYNKKYSCFNGFCGTAPLSSPQRSPSIVGNPSALKPIVPSCNPDHWKTYIFKVMDNSKRSTNDHRI
jgi:hypothetical protein